MLEELLLGDSTGEHVAFLEEPRTSAGVIRLAYALHAVSTSLAEIRDLLEWFGVSRTRQAVHYWFHAYADACDQEFIAKPDRVAVDEKQVQLAGGEKVWLYAAIDVDSKSCFTHDFLSIVVETLHHVSPRTQRGTPRLRRGVPRRRHGLSHGVSSD